MALRPSSRPMSNGALTNCLTVQDVILTLTGQMNKTSSWNPWRPQDPVKELLFNEQRQGSLPRNVAFTPRRVSKKAATSSVWIPSPFWMRNKSSLKMKTLLAIISFVFEFFYFLKTCFSLLKTCWREQYRFFTTTTKRKVLARWWQIHTHIPFNDWSLGFSLYCST